MSVTASKGFRAAGVGAGIKSNGKRDLALVVNDGPKQVAAGVFTSNRVCAAPVKLSRKVLADGNAHAVVLNSGGANACTGEKGDTDAATTGHTVAMGLGREENDVAVCSTGLIGVYLPMDRLLSGVTLAIEQLSSDGGTDAAHAIMTTDTVPKQTVFQGNGWSVGGMAKGAGMLAPALATMLVVITTDVDISAEALRQVLCKSTRVSFDRIDSDGCMSTNDSVIALASGASGMQVEAAEFLDAMTSVCKDLARQLIADAEGAHHDIAINVCNAATEQDALDVARSVARNNLLKCAIFGNDPNWGRVLAAVGTTSATFNPDHLDVIMNGVKVCEQGAAGHEDRSQVDLSGREVTIDIDLHAGSESATIWTNDLTQEYVHENSAYSS